MRPANSQARQPRRQIKRRIRSQTQWLRTPIPRCRRFCPSPATRGNAQQLTTAVMVVEAKSLSVPSLIGLPVRKVIEQAAAAGLEVQSPAAVQCANRLPLRDDGRPRNADRGPLRAVVRTQSLAETVHIPSGHLRVPSSDSPVSSRLLRLARIIGHPPETALMSFESVLSISCVTVSLTESPFCFKLVGQARKALRGHLGKHMILPLEDQPPMRLDFNHFAAVGCAPVGFNDAPRCARLPFATPALYPSRTGA